MQTTWPFSDSLQSPWLKPTMQAFPGSSVTKNIHARSKVSVFLAPGKAVRSHLHFEKCLNKNKEKRKICATISVACHRSPQLAEGLNRWN